MWLHFSQAFAKRILLKTGFQSENAVKAWQRQWYETTLSSLIPHFGSKSHENRVSLFAKQLHKSKHLIKLFSKVLYPMHGNNCELLFVRITAYNWHICKMARPQRTCKLQFHSYLRGNLKVQTFEYRHFANLPSVMCKATFDVFYKVRSTNSVMIHITQQPRLLRKILQMLFRYYSFCF